MPEAIDVLAGDCTVIEDEGATRREHRGRVVAVVKPDDTVLVHDATGYQPVAWITRAESVTCARAGGREATGPAAADGPDPAPDGGAPTADGSARGETFAIAARKGETRLRVALHEGEGFARYPATRAGRSVGECPDCSAPLVRSGRSVTCLDCGDRYGLPEGGTVRAETCDCGLPTLRVERGTAFDLCLDRDCEHSRTLDEALKSAFDRAWDCPACGADLRILRRGGIIAGCERYPDCETGFVVPRGTVAGECPCGLPAFVADGDRRCLDSTCEYGGGEG